MEKVPYYFEWSISGCLLLYWSCMNSSMRSSCWGRSGGPGTPCAGAFSCALSRDPVPMIFAAAGTYSVTIFILASEQPQRYVPIWKIIGFALTLLDTLSDNTRLLILTLRMARIVGCLVELLLEGGLLLLLLLIRFRSLTSWSHGKKLLMCMMYMNSTTFQILCFPA